MTNLAVLLTSDGVAFKRWELTLRIGRKFVYRIMLMHSISHTAKRIGTKLYSSLFGLVKTGYGMLTIGPPGVKGRIYLEPKNPKPKTWCQTDTEIVAST